MSGLSSSETQIQAQVSTLATIRKAWAETCVQAGGEWVITEPETVVEDIRLRKKEIKRCKSRIRAARWHGWRFRRLSRTFHKRSDQLAVKEQACEQVRDRHQQTSQALADIEEELRKLARPRMRPGNSWPKGWSPSMNRCRRWVRNRSCWRACGTGVRNTASTCWTRCLGRRDQLTRRATAGPPTGVGAHPGTARDGLRGTGGRQRPV